MCTNNNCGCTGHSIENCYWRGGGKEGQFPPNFGRRRRNAASSQPNPNPQLNTHNPAANLADTTTQNLHTTYALMANLPFALAAVYNQDLEPLESYLSGVEISAGAFAIPAVGEAVLTYADSRATNHCFVRRTEFEDYQAYSTPRRGVSANQGGIFSIMGEGTIRKMVSTNGHTSQLVFKGALHTPDLSANLISIRKFDNLGFSVVFKEGRASFVDLRGRTFMTGEKKNQMYLLDLSPVLSPSVPMQTTPIAPPNTETPQPRVLVATSLDKPAPLDVWHRRFGHASVQSI